LGIDNKAKLHRQADKPKREKREKEADDSASMVDWMAKIGKEIVMSA